VITEKLARRRFNDLLDAEHPLGSRQPKGRSLYQVICRGDEWVGLVLWTAAIWHPNPRQPTHPARPCTEPIGAGTPLVPQPKAATDARVCGASAPLSPMPRGVTSPKLAD
jgi:hypothetical protein